MNASHTKEAFPPSFVTKACTMPLHASFKIEQNCSEDWKLCNSGKLDWKVSYAQILCLTSNFNLTKSTGVPKEWGKVTKKGSGNSLPHFLMTPASGTQAADIISNSKADGKFHPVINSHHFFFFKKLWFALTAAWLISSTQRIGFKPQRGTSTWRRTVVETWGDRVLCL